MKTLIAQRVFGLALGYEDLLDHDDLRRDPLLGAVMGRIDRDSDWPAPLAGKSTVNSLEHAPTANRKTRYHEIDHEMLLSKGLFLELFHDARD
jgi:hypothetical protein